MPLLQPAYVAGIIFFAYFYTAIIFNPDDGRRNMRKYAACDGSGRAAEPIHDKILARTPPDTRAPGPSAPDYLAMLAICRLS